MRVGILGPVSTARLSPLLDDDHEGLPPGLGGPPVTQLVEALVLAGHDVSVWTLDPTVSRPVRAQGSALDITYLPRRVGGRGRDLYAVERRWLVGAIADADVDVMHAHWSYEFAMAAQTRVGPLVVTAHDWAPTILRYQPDPYRLARLLMFGRVHARRPHMTVPSPHLRDRFRRAGLGTPRVVPNGVAPDLLAAGPRTRGTGAAVVSVAMGFGRLKNTTALIQAHDRVRRAGMPVTLTLLGSQHGPGGPAQAWAQARGAADGIRFVGEVPHDTAMQHIREADLMVHPSKEESFGMVVAEAMAQGTPVIGGRRSGAVPWVLDRGRSGVLVDVGDPAAIAAAMQQVLSDQARWQALSRRGHDDVAARFAMDVVRDGYLAAYAEALEHAR